MSVTKTYNLPAKIEGYLRILALKYKQDQNKILEKVVVNAKYQIQEEFSYDNWNGGTVGHALVLTLPESIFIDVIAERENLQNILSHDLRSLNSVPNEFIDHVTFEISTEANDENWREKSETFVLPRKIVVTEENTNKLWEVGGLRLFLSHKAQFKKETAELKEYLSLFGISCFVAHEDIEPSSEWQQAIENALFSMDVLVALLTSDFHDSNWTDQEVGFALGRQVPVIPIRMGKDPYGFMGKYQGINGAKEKESELLKVLFTHREIKNKMVAAFAQAMANSPSFWHSDELAIALPFLKSLSSSETQLLIDAYNSNSQIYYSFSFNGSKSQSYGMGLMYFLHQNSPEKFTYQGHRIHKVS